MNPTSLPFEYPFQWDNESLREGAGVSPEAAATLKQRDRDLEDFLATLGGGGCVGEGFRLVAFETIGTGTNQYLPWANTSTKTFLSSGVTIATTSVTPDDSAAVPAGIWTVTASVQWRTIFSVLPTTGSLEMRLRYGSSNVIDHVARLYPADFASSSDQPVVALHATVYADPAESDSTRQFQVEVVNGTDVDLNCAAFINGSRACDPTSVT